MPRRFYRVVRTDPPMLDDFRSYLDLGRPLPDDDPETLRLAGGLSVNATIGQARARARSLPRLGRFVAELEIPHDAPIRIERTGRQRGHHTLWGTPEVLMRYVIALHQVRDWSGSP